MIDPLSRRDMIDASLNGTFSYVFLISEASQTPWSGRPSSRETAPPQHDLTPNGGWIQA